MMHKLIQGSRGSALVVSLMLMVALASVAMVAMNKLVGQGNYVSNERKGSQAYHVTESGLYTTLALADSLGASGFLSALEVSQGTAQAQDSSQGFIPSDLTSGGMAYFDLSESGSFGYEGAAMQGDLAEDPSLSAPVDFRVTVTATGMVQPLVGYSLNGEGSRCRFKYRVDSNGSVGHQKEGKDTTTGFGAWKRIRALIYFGPLPCKKNAGGVGSS
jgi:hypothetical protein